MNVIVTGASKGIGKAIAGIFAAHAHSLFLCARGETALYETMQELQTRHPVANIKARPFDLSRKEDAKSFGTWCLGFGVPDIVVNNAGFFEPGQLHNQPEGTLENQLAVNLYSAYHLTRTVLPAMMEKRSGHIFNICSIASLHAYNDGGAYSISKFALYGLTKNLREEMKPYGIKVTAVLPGAVMTDSWGNFDNSRQRIMEPADIAQLVYTSSQLSAAACVEDIIIRPQLGDL